MRACSPFLAPLRDQTGRFHRGPLRCLPEFSPAGREGYVTGPAQPPVRLREAIPRFVDATPAGDLDPETR